LAALVPWDDLASIYAKNLNPKAGRLSVDMRMVIGALIIKHKLNLSDRDTVDMISENLYMQYFYGLKSMQTELPFDASLFFDQFNETVIRRYESIKPKRKRIIKKASPNDKESKDDPGEQSPVIRGKSSSKKDIPNQGKLKLDASVADQYITYPNDLKLVNRAREETESLVDVLYEKESFDKKPAPTVAV
jgi:IS5 family transposase